MYEYARILAGIKIILNSNLQSQYSECEEAQKVYNSFHNDCVK
jgi:hypothetical protein